MGRVPVYAGISTPTQYMKQVEWAAGFSSPSLHESGGIEFMRREINARPGKVTLIAVGELTNMAALLEAEPGIGKKIRAISLMGGSIYRGYAAGSKPEPEWNIKSNAKAAQTVFESGVPLLVAPLDSTADLKLTPEMRVEDIRARRAAQRCTGCTGPGLAAHESLEGRRPDAVRRAGRGAGARCDTRWIAVERGLSAWRRTRQMRRWRSR